jgi:hypothetical protein
MDMGTAAIIVPMLVAVAGRAVVVGVRHHRTFRVMK